MEEYLAPLSDAQIYVFINRWSNALHHYKVLGPGHDSLLRAIHLATRMLRERRSIRCGAC